VVSLSDLASRPDVQLGPLLVSPARRLFEGPSGSAHLPPLAMQIFLILLDADGAVVTRNHLFDECWGGAAVGDDSLNNVIAKIRRASAKAAPAFLEIETIPRTGYRLTGEPWSDSGARVDGGISRRRVMFAGSALAGVAAIAGYAVMDARNDDRRFQRLMRRGADALRLDESHADRHFQKAAEIRPDSAEAWGLLAYALGNGGFTGPSFNDAARVESTARAAQRSLDIDPSQPNALLAMLAIKDQLVDIREREERYRRILRLSPNNVLVMRQLGTLLHGVGRCRESLKLAERALTVEPLIPDQWSRRAIRLWVLGRVADADRVIDGAFQLWPSHRMVRLARLMIYAFTDRIAAAMQLIDAETRQPVVLTKATAANWRISLTALETRSKPAIGEALDVNLTTARISPPTAAWSMLILSALGELDAAFDVASGFLLHRGPLVAARASVEAGVNAGGWRNTFGLFTPPTKAMRLDGRFSGLADGLGLTSYWAKAGIRPDSFLFEP
jgi:DNA-binding winged helix-turn-helix (wHTH) protein